MVGHPDERFLPILTRYSEGKVSAYDAACEIPKPNFRGFDDPGASEVIVRARMAGYSVPAPSREEARREAEEILPKR